LAVDGGELLDAYPDSFIDRKRAFDIQWIEIWIGPEYCLNKKKKPFPVQA
jgi:hypothetical protein